VFRPIANSLSKISVVGAVVLIGSLGAILYGINESPYVSNAKIPHDQPVPFSHKHHVAGLGLDCRYCHSTVETSAFAGIPPTETCMSCHSQIWTNADMLEPVRASWRTGESLVWRRVHDLPGYVYFNHSIHVNKGIGCESCHGRVDQMPLMHQENTLYMEWCLDCHRNPAKNIRPKDQVYTMGYKYPPNQEEVGAKLMAEYKVQSLTDCWTCHR
jgi:hypothetical protein